MTTNGIVTNGHGNHHDEDIVISGISGRYPKCDNLLELRDALMTKTDLISEDEVRYKHDHPELPLGIGHLNRIDRFDPGFFGMDHWTADNMDPMLRVMMEQVVEALFDAGVSPRELEGTRTAVVLGIMVCEAEISHNQRNVPQARLARAGYHSSTFAQQIAKFLKLKGPAYLLDTACSSSLISIDHACKAVRAGEVDGALVLGGNLLLHPNVSLQYCRMGVSCRNGRCKVFDESADGYGRSEIIACTYIQKMKDARRAYAKILHFGENTDGFKAESINFPSREGQATLLREFYDECGVLPDDLSYLETHGTATKVGDVEETAAIDAALGRHRKRPLLIGSIKSNMGHGEAASGFASISKCVLTLEGGIIPPNINYHKTNPKLKCILEGRLKVVAEPTPLDANGLIGINNFGFGGTNSHVLLKRNDKDKINGGLPDDDVPRLVLLSGRTENAVAVLQDDFKARGLDQEYVALLNKVFGPGVSEHLYRGYSIVSKSGELIRSVSTYEGKRLPLYILFGSQFDSWHIAGQELMAIPKVAAVFKRIQDSIIAMSNIHIDFSPRGKNQDPIYDILGNFTVLMGLTALLKDLKLEPNCIFAFGVGKLAKLYFDGNFDLKDACTVALQLSKVIAEKLETKRNGNGYGIRQLLNSLVKNADELDEKLPTESIIFNVGITRECSQAGKDKAVVLDIKRDDFVVSFLQSLGRLFESGHQFDVEKIYPKVEFPVSRGTPMIAPLIKWNHNKSWYVVNFPSTNATKRFAGRYTTKALKDDFTKYTMELNGEHVFSAASFLMLVWHRCFQQDQPVIFTNCHFNGELVIPSVDNLELVIMLDHFTGSFQILLDNSTLVRGYVKESLSEISLPKSDVDDKVKLSRSEIYKILLLKGLEFSPRYKRLSEANLQATNGKIDFTNKWPLLLSNMFQLKQLRGDSRWSRDPVFVKSVSINAKKHSNFTKSSSHLEVNFWPSADVIKCGGVQICGLEFDEIFDLKPDFDSKFFDVAFVPNVEKLSIEESTAVNLQLVKENSKSGVSLDAVELIDDSYDETKQNMAELLLDKLPQYKIFDKFEVKIASLDAESQKKVPSKTNVKVINNLKNFGNYRLVVCTKAFESTQKLENTINLTHPEGFVISRESPDFNPANQNVNVISVHTTDTERLVLFNRKTKPLNYEVIEASSTTFDWIKQLKRLDPSTNIVLYSDDPHSGVVSFANSLRNEVYYENLQCVLVDRSGPKFSTSNKLFVNQLNRKMFINVYRDGWGTFRYEPPRGADLVKKPVASIGQSLDWIEAPSNDKDQVEVHYVSLGSENEIEYSGYDNNGIRTAGLAAGVVSTTMMSDELSWIVPNDWSLQEAATVSKAYYTALFALKIKAKIRQRGSLVIRNAVTDVGMAAMKVGEALGNSIYLLVSSKKDVEFLKKRFPKHKHIYSEQECYLDKIKKDTRGVGVDAVFDCSDNERPIIECLKPRGAYVSLRTPNLTTGDETSFHQVTVEQIIASRPELKSELKAHFDELLDKRSVLPLPAKIYRRDELRDATEAARSERVVVRVRDDEAFASGEKFSCFPKRYFSSEASYVVVGDTDDLCIEFVRWMVRRGARKIKLATKFSTIDGRQSLLLESCKEKGATITIFGDALVERQNVDRLIEESNKLGPLKGIFYFVKESYPIPFEDLRPADLEKAYNATVKPVLHFADLAADFVVFTSPSGLGDEADVTMEAFVNGSLGRISEDRRARGLPSTVIQWGPISINGEVNGNRSRQASQDIFDCVRALDVALDYCGSVVHYVSLNQGEYDNSSQDHLNRLALLLGVKLLEISPYATFSDLGINSVTLSEVKSYLEANFDRILTDDETRSFTFANIKELLENC